MLEIIELIAETIAKSLSIESLLKNRKEKRLDEIGTELFLLYTALNNILATGRSIVWELEHGLDWLDRKATGEPDRVLFTNIGFKLQQQKINILQFVASLKRLGLKMQVIAPDVFLKLGPTIFGKLNALSGLLDAMAAARLFSVSEDNLRVLMDIAAKEAEQHGPIQSADDVRHLAFTVAREHLDLLAKVIVDEGVENLSHIPAKYNQVIRAYLEKRKPRKELDAIEKVAKQLRATIAENFSLNDILLSVGDERGGLGDPYVGF